MNSSPTPSSMISSLDVLIPAVQDLHKFDLRDNTPNIQISSQTIALETNACEASFSDREGFESCFGRDLQQVVRIEEMIEQGQQFVYMLYTFRSVSRAIPMVSVPIPEGATTEVREELEAKKDEINRRIIEILRPEILKLKDLMIFISSFVSQFRECILYLASSEAKENIVSEGVYSVLIKAIDLLIKLDSLKDLKASINNDFIRYKHAIRLQTKSARNTVTSEMNDELTQLQLFLNNPDPRKAKNCIYLTLREEVKQVIGHEEVLAELLDLAMEDVDSMHYLTPDEKHRKLRVLPFIMLLIDGIPEDPKSINIFKSKIVDCTKLQRLFQKMPIIPLFADMHINVEYVLERSAHYDRTTMKALWGEPTDPKLIATHSLLHHAKVIKEDYNSYTARLMCIIHEVDHFTFSKVIDDIHVDRAERVYNIAKDGLRLISDWSGLISRTLSWKCSHPASLEQLKLLSVDESSPGFEYERVMKYNFSKEELTMLVDLITMIKSLTSMLGQAKVKFAPILRYSIHHKIQQLAQGDILPALHRADKRKKDSFQCLFQIRLLAADWTGGVEPRDDFKSYSRKQGHVRVTHAARAVGPSATQLELLRTQVRVLYDEKSTARKKSSFFSKADLEKEDVALLEAFYHESFHYPYLLDFSGSLRAVSDLSELWFRELYLEVTKCVQFPIDTSLPWIITEHIITNHDGHLPMLESVFYAMDIYNDAANRSLFVLNQQYLYDEVEAEINLVFDQLIFLIADEIYSHYKNLAASIKLDKDYKEKLEQLSNGSLDFLVGQRKFEIPMAQRNIQLLGRTIDLNFLIGQHINNKIMFDIEFALKKFECSDITGILELDLVIKVIKETHSLLSEHLNIDLFDCLFNEVNEAYGVVGTRGVLNTHIVRVLIGDLFPNFSYNIYTQRFVRSPICVRNFQLDKPPRQPSPNLYFGALCSKAYESYIKLNRPFFGKQDFERLFHIAAGYIDLSYILEECTRALADRLKDIQEYSEALRDGIPPTSLPKYKFRSGGCFGYFELKLKPLLEYEDLKKEVFQNFKEIGNTLFFFRDVSEILGVTDQYKFMAAAPFLGISPSTVILPSDHRGGPTNNNSKPIGGLHSATTAGFNSDNTNIPPDQQQFPIDIDTLSKSSPIGHVLNQFLFEARSIPRLIISAPVINQLPELSLKTVNYLGGAVENSCVFRSILKKMHQILIDHQFIADWSGEMAANGAINTDDSKNFHRLWSALSFLFCLHDDGTTASSLNADDESALPVTDEEEFGHGFIIAGCAILHMLHQRAAFELLDFSQHILNVFNYENQSTLNSSSQVGLVDSTLQAKSDSFIASARLVHNVQKEVFSLLEATHRRPAGSGSTILFRPPKQD